MKILYVTAEGFDTPNPNNQMAEKLIDTFLKNGFHVHLVQSHRKGINKDIPDILSERENLTVDTVKRNVVDKSNFIKRYFNDMRYAFQSMAKWRKVKDVDAIYLQSNPTIIFPMILLKLFKRKPIVYVIYDVFPGYAHEIGVVKSKVLYEIMRIVQKPCYKLADRITVLAEDMKSKVVEQGGDPDKIRVIPAWFDVETTKEIPDAENRFMKRYDIDPLKFYVQFAGTIGYVFRYETFIELAERIRDYNDIELQIIGDGAARNEFEEKVRERGLDNIKFYPLQPIDMVPDVYSTCDVCLIPLKKSVIGNGIPSKAPILMACRRIVVNSLESDSAYAKMFVNNEMGISVDIDEPDALAEAIIYLYNNPDKVKDMVDRAEVFVKENYSSDICTAKVMDVFRELEN